MRGVLGINDLKQHTGLFGFIGDKLPELIESPAPHAVALRLAKPYPVTDALEVFKSYTATGVFGLRNESLGEDVIGIATKTGFSIRNALELLANTLTSSCISSQLQVEQRGVDSRYAPLKSLLTEECLGVAVRGSNNPRLVPEEDALSLLSLEPGRNMADGQKTRLIGQALDAIPTLEDTFTRLAHERARALLADHRRIRDASDAKGLRYEVIPALPVDKIGVYVFMPMASL